MRILIIAPEYPPHNIGGGGIVVQNVGRSLSRRGHAVTIVAGYYPTRTFIERSTEGQDDGCKILWLPLIPEPKTSLNLKTGMPPNVFSSLKLLQSILADDYDIVHIHGFGHLLVDFAALLCTARRVPYVLTLHGFPASPTKSSVTARILYSAYSVTLGRTTMNSAEKIIAVSPSVKVEAINRGVKKDKIVVIPNGVDLAMYSTATDSEAFRKEHGIEPNEKLIVAIGSMSERKGFQHLLAALPMIEKQLDCKLFLIGVDGGFVTQLKNQTVQLNIERAVTFCGFLDFNTKLAALRAADVLVIPSLSEPFGLVALEAMATETPIVATRVGGLATILEDGETALLVEPGASEPLARAITRLLTSAHLQQTLVNKSRKLVTKYDWNLVADRYLLCYQEISTKKNRSRLNCVAQN